MKKTVNCSRLTPLMSKSKKHFGLVVLLVMGFGICCVGWRIQKHSGQKLMLEQKRERLDSAPFLEVNSEPQSQHEAARPEDAVDAMKELERFDMAMKDLRNKRGDDWIDGLKIIGNDVNRLAKRSEFESVTAAALMVKRISDLTIGRLMAGEVAADETNYALSVINYQIPDDQTLVRFIGQYYPGAVKEQIRKAPESVLEFLARFEPEVIFPDEESIPGKTMSGMISEHNATLSLLSIAWAKSQLELAKITALYLSRGGNRNFRGKDLDVDVEIRIGNEIRLVAVPKFVGALGNMNPTAADISNAIDQALSDFEQHK